MTETFVQHVQGFAAATLRNEAIEMTVVPALGAKIVSLINRRTGRQWLWHPPGALKLFGNAIGDPFERGTMCGIDECVPTVAPCTLEGRALPDHGEGWSVPWEWDPRDLKLRGRLRTALRLPVSPLRFERTVTLDGQQVALAYRLTNLSDGPRPYLWAMHPLLRMEPGDGIALPGGVTEVVVECSLTAEGVSAPRGERWAWPSPAPGVRLDSMDLGSGSGGAFAKLFVPSLPDRRATVRNAVTGEHLTISFAGVAAHAGAPDCLGLWITRGGWNGFEHFAIEPTHAPADSLAVAVAEGRCPVLPVGASHAWRVRLSLGGGR